MSRVFCVLAVALGLLAVASPAPAPAQDIRPPESDHVKRLEKRIELLEAQLGHLRKEKALPNGAGGKGFDFSKVRKQIQDLMVANSLASVSVAVARGDEILWEEGFGWADREHRRPATAHTMYGLASVSKPITATAVMVLRERKQLDLDRPVNDYLGPARVSSPAWDPARATVRRVATHTAGLSTFDLGFEADRPGSRLPAEEVIRRYGVLVWPPGDHFDYSNLGYGILGEVIARVSGKSFGDFLRDEVFWPLGMTRASLGVGPELGPYVAARYRSGIGGVSGRSPPPGEAAAPGASAVYCSAHDLARFGMFHVKAHVPNQKAILSDASIDAMQNSTVDNGGGRYGLGWWVDEDCYGYRGVVGMGGSDDAAAFLQLIPSEGIVVVVLVNTGTPHARSVVHEILSVVLPGYREKREKERQEKANRNERLPQPDPNPPPGLFVGDWTGLVKTHRGNVPLTFSITATGEVRAKLGTQLGTLLTDARFDKGKLTGRMTGDLGTEEGNGPISFELPVRGDDLNGVATIQGRTGRLSYWVELKKPGGREK
jgi:CubicO group peptidase (beta-lactamase class C family)